jgi:competence protein ComEA
MPSAASAPLVVDVEGKVAHPGVVRVPTGSRVIDALAAAGGALPGANTTSLDLARPLVDGEQLRVDLPGVAVGPAAVATGAPTTASGTSGSGGPRVNLNTATIAALDVLPGVGPVTAQHILDWREQHGRFTSIAQLQEVPGIGPATYTRLAPLVTV